MRVNLKGGFFGLSSRIARPSLSDSGFSGDIKGLKRVSDPEKAPFLLA
jgi:hypothetical protein